MLDIITYKCIYISRERERDLGVWRGWWETRNGENGFPRKRKGKREARIKILGGGYSSSKATDFISIQRSIIIS